MLQRDEAIGECEQMVSAIASLHLRLVVCNWRRGMFRNGLTVEMERVRAEVEMEEAALGGEVAAGGDIAEMMLRSINLEREQRERSAVGGGTTSNVSSLGQRGQTVGQQQTILKMVQRRHIFQMGGSFLSSEGAMVAGGGVSIEEALLGGEGDQASAEGRWYGREDGGDAKGGVGQLNDLTTCANGSGGDWDVRACGGDEHLWGRERGGKKEIAGLFNEESGDAWKKQALKEGRAKYGGLTAALTRPMSLEGGEAGAVSAIISGEARVVRSGGNSDSVTGGRDFGLLKEEGDKELPPRYSDVRERWTEEAFIEQQGRALLEGVHHTLPGFVGSAERVEMVGAEALGKEERQRAGGLTERERTLEEALNKLVGHFTTVLPWKPKLSPTPHSCNCAILVQFLLNSPHEFE